MKSQCREYLWKTVNLRKIINERNLILRQWNYDYSNLTWVKVKLCQEMWIPICIGLFTDWHIICSYFLFRYAFSLQVFWWWIKVKEGFGILSCHKPATHLTFACHFTCMYIKSGGKTVCSEPHKPFCLFSNFPFISHWWHSGQHEFVQWNSKL
jgi:hypothetical protein